MNLSDILREARQEVTGTEVEETGAVVIKPTAAGQPTTISNNAGVAGITLNDNLEIQLGSGQNITSVTNIINPVDPNNSLLLSTVTGIESRIQEALGSALTFVKIDSKAAFDTFLAASVIDPSSVLVTDNAPFDYTDTNGVINTQITYWQGIVTKPTAGDALSSNTLATSNSANTMTGAEIAAALFAEPDTNNLTDVRATVTDTIEATVTAGLATKENSVAGQGLSENNLTNALLAKIDNAPADTQAALDDKLSITSNSEVVLNSTSNSGGKIEFVATDAPANQKRFRFGGLNTGILSLARVQDDDFAIIHSSFTQTGLEVAGTVSQGGNNVVDVTNSTFVNIPADTNAALALKEDSVPGLGLSENSFTDAEQTKLAGIPDISGGFTTPSIVVSNDLPTSFSLKSIVNNDAVNGITWQNNGSTYKSAILRSPNDEQNALFFKLGSNSDPLSLSDVFKLTGTLITSFTNFTATGDISGVNISASGDFSANNVTVNNQGQINLSNTAAPVDERNSVIYHGDDGSLNLELRDALDVAVDTLKLDNTGILNLPAGLKFLDGGGRELYFQPQSNGLRLVTSPNVPTGESIFSITSSGGSLRFDVKQLGDITSSNAEMRLGTSSDGNDGNFVFHEGNRGLANQHVLRIGNHLLVTADFIEAKGTVLELHGIGGDTATLPTIADVGSSNGDFNQGETFTVVNANGSGDFTFNLPSGYDYAIVRTNNIVNTPITILDGSTIRFTAIDSSNSQYSNKTWFVTPIADN